MAQTIFSILSYITEKLLDELCAILNEEILGTNTIKIKSIPAEGKHAMVMRWENIFNKNV
jgi:hypothetical protein